MRADRPHRTWPADELHELGHAIDVPSRDPDLVADQVMTRLADSERSVRTHGRRWRPALAAAFVVLAVLALTPPVRAAVTEWFGVIITPGEPVEGGNSSVPGADGDLGLREAGDLVPFDPVVPDRLVDAHGNPDGVEVSEDRRTLALSWSTADGTIRLDQFAGGMTPMFLKHAEYEEITVDGRRAIWIGHTHFLAPLNAGGDKYSDSDRHAGATLIWPVGELTLRLEGLDRAAAIEVARSTAGTG